MSTSLWSTANNLSFKTKTIVLAVLLGIVPVVAVGTIDYLQTSNANYQQAIKTQKLQAARVADKLNRYMFERTGDTDILSSLPVIADPKISKIASEADKIKILDRFIGSYNIYDSIGFFDLNGNPIAQSSGAKLKNHADREYFKEALKDTTKTYISKAEISKYTGKPVIFLSRAVKDLNTGQVIGVVRTRIPIDKLELPLADLATKWENYHIFDRRNNKVFISSNSQYANKAVTPQIETAQNKGEVVTVTSLAADRKYKDPTQAIEGDRAELLSAAKFQKLGGMPELPWTAVATIDEQEVTNELQALLLTVLAGSAVSAVLTAGAAIFISTQVAKYIQRTISTITNSANEIVDTVQIQEIAVNDQALSAISTAETVNELETISTETATQAAASADGAQQALSLAETGTQAVRETINEMSELRERVDEIAQQIISLSEQTGQINNISNLVADLAKQTNMLALKASVEAARAGEQGKGFGVVAGEIRKLADESKKSAQKIDDLATDIRLSIDRTVQVTDRGTRTITQGIQLAENTATTFAGVTDAVGNVFMNSQQISTSTQRQASAIQQVLAAMNDITQGSQESAVGMHRIKTSTAELNQVADELQSAVS